MAESSSGTTSSDAGKMWECFHPGCKQKLPVKVAKMFQFCPGCGKDILQKPNRSTALDSKESQAENRDHKKLSDRARLKFDELPTRRLGSVLGAVLSKQYPKLDEGNTTISFDELLEWYLWPNFLKIYNGSNSELKAGLPEDGIVACTCALTAFNILCDMLKTGDITVCDLTKIQRNENQMNRLCEAMSKCPNDGQPSYDDLRTTLLKRLYELHTFQQSKKKYLCICNTVPSPYRVHGLVELKQEVESDYSDCAIKKLCSVEGGHVQLKCFQAAHPLDECAEHFMTMTKMQSNLFMHLLEEKTKQVDTDLTLASFSTLVWQPVFQQCQRLLDSLIDQTITLSNVDKNFKKLAESLEAQVVSLANGIHECLRVPISSRKLQLAVSRVHSYWRICEYHDGVNVFLQLKEVLNLQNGDFRLVEAFSSQFSSVTKDQTLADVSDTLIETGHSMIETACFLEDVAQDPQKKASLEMFVQCQDVIKWLRETTRDVSDIQGFVTVALATAAGGEDDHAHDRLSNLRTVGSGFASFIYNINSQDGYRQLEAKCKSVWEALEENPALPKLLEGCNKDLSWYQSVRETQGSVKTTPYEDEMKNILKYGCYRVGLPSGATPHSVHDLISMTLKEKDKKLPKKNYTLDELRDLESKLVLICGNKAESRTEVDHFLNLLHNVTRIAEVFLDLQQAGNIEHSGNIFTFKCAQYSGGMRYPMFLELVGKELVELLRDHAKLLEKALDDWKITIQEARSRYYQLNYYTTVQLLILRKEFGHFTASSSYCLSPNVMALLQRVSPLIAYSSRRDSVLKVITEQLQISLTDISTGRIPLTIDSDSTLEQFESDPDTQEEIVEAPSESATIPKPCPMHSSSKASVSVASRSVTVPSITISDLNDEQKEILTRAVNHLRYSKLHVLRAFEECGLEANKYDIEKWCDDNDDLYSSSDEEDGSETGESELNEEDQTTLSESSNESEKEDVVIKPFHPISKLSGTLSIFTRQMSIRSHQVISDKPHTLSIFSKASVSVASRSVPSITMSDLNDEQKEILTRAVNHLRYSKLHVLRAFEECGLEANKYDIEKWCDDNDDLYSSSDEEDGSETGESELNEEDQTTLSESSNESEKEDVVIKPFHPISKLSGKSSKQRPKQAHASPKIKTVIRQSIDHSDYGLEESINAVEQFGSLAECDAMDFLDGDDDPNEGGLFHRSLSQDHTSLSSLPGALFEEEGFDVYLLCDPDAGKKYFTLDQLGRTLQLLNGVSLTSAVPVPRPFNNTLLKSGHPNLLVTPPELVLRTVLSLYMHNMDKVDCPLPTHEEVLICNSTTTTEEVILLWRKSIFDPGFTRIFCLAHAERLSYQVCDASLRALSELSQGRKDYRLVIVCSKEDEEKSHIISKLHLFRRPAIPSFSDDECKQYLKSHFVQRSQDGIDSYQRVSGITAAYASIVDPEMSCVRVVSSTRSGMGKSLYIQRMTESLQTKCPSRSDVCVTIPVHGPVITADMMLDYFENCMEKDACTIYHLDIAPAILPDVDTVLFSLLILRGLDDSKGRVWRCHPRQLYAVEVTLPAKQQVDYQEAVTPSQTLELLKLLPSMKCISPCNAIKATNPQEIGMDQKEFEGPTIQRVYQYLRRHSANRGVVSVSDCLKIILAKCGIRDPSWSEIHHFTKLLDMQLNACKDSVDTANRRTLEKAIMRSQLYAGLKQNRINFGEDYRGWRKDQMISKIATVMGIDFVHDPDDNYVLTTDNLIKILAIQMRFRCDIPVVIMGETGCGKTRLILYMCDLARQGQNIRNLLIMKIHGGITDTDVAEFVKRAETVAEENKAINKGVDTVVFFDEANTTDSIGLIKEIMCDRRLKGRPISRDLKFIAVCNPYRRHTEEMIEKLETAGLGFYVRESETQQKLGKIPLRQLVYRVLDLPPSMRPLVYDFGQLNTGTEHDYTSQIVKDHVKKHPDLSTESPSIIPAIAVVLAKSQEYMRDQKNECSFVSLRDVERAMIVFEYFYEKMDLFAPLINEKAELEITESEDEYEESDEEEGLLAAPVKQVLHPSNITRALVLAVSICYHARLQDREGYENFISGQFQNPLNLPNGAQDFRNQIKWCQEVLLDNMRLGSNIARNAALRENVFMMSICIELRIPLFLVGKPGSSKSLAKSIIQDSMHGQGSQTELLRGFKQVHMFSYQCSQLSTPESVIEVFKQADKFQAKLDTKQYVLVVVLDEVGLAEDSPNLPLKALHPLLEDGTEGAGKDDQQKTIGREKRVAFIGISNWALDPAKMNRGVMVTRGDPGLEELTLSARGICSNQVNDPIRERLQDCFHPLSRAYMEICQKQERQFFGLGDFYSLIKMLYRMCKRTEGLPLSGPQLEHAIKRNFGGLISDTFDPIEIFREMVDLNNHPWELSSLPEKIRKEINPDCSRLGLIKTSLHTKDTTWNGENRYLLFLTENYVALDILEHYLTVGSEPTESRAGRSEEDSNSEEEITSKPFTLFGSSFPKDKEYTQICRNINQIKICMETGRTVILLNLENLYESLYDVLSQYYVYFGGVRYVDLGLPTHRVKCRVHENFKLILIAEKNTVYEKFPTPLINRLEKHIVLTSSVLEEWQQVVLEEFTIWIHQFSNTSDSRGNRFKEPHAFIGYQKDTPAAVVFQATNQMQAILRNGGSMSPAWQRLERAGVLENIRPEDLLMEDQDCEEWKVTVFKLSQYLLLQTASEDALFRLKHSKLPKREIKHAMDVYYHSQEHSSILDFLEYSINQRDYGCSNELFFQVTTHSHLMNDEELAGASQIISGEIVCYDLHEFDTELDFSNKISPTFHRDDGESHSSLVIIQCDSGHHNSDLIACARYRVYDEAVRAKSKKRIQDRNTGATHVLFVIRLPPQEIVSTFVGFQGDPWVSVHIDNL